MEYIHLQNEYGSTALMSASYEGHTDTVQILLDAGANLQDNDETTALIFASRRGYTDIVKLLSK